MSSPSMIFVRDESPMSSSSVPGPRSGEPASRRTISPAQKLDHLVALKAAITRNEGGVYLREQSIYSSQISEWRKLRGTGSERRVDMGRCHSAQQTLWWMGLPQTRTYDEYVFVQREAEPIV